MAIIIGRPINGISLNELEFLLNNDGTEMQFKNKNSAKHFLVKSGFPEENLDGFTFVKIDDKS